MCSALQSEASEHAATTTEDVYETPGEDECENEFDDTVCARCDERRVGTYNTCIFENL